MKRIFDLTSSKHYSARVGTEKYRVVEQLLSIVRARVRSEPKAAEGEAEREVLEDAGDIDEAAEV
jgi:hypothetical protein